MYYKLFTTTTCYKCKKLKEEFYKLNRTPYFNIIEGEEIDENNEKFHDEIYKLNITSVPTIIFYDANGITKKEDSKEVFRTNESYELIEYLENNFTFKNK